LGCALYIRCALSIKNTVLVFERQILGKLFGPIQCEKGWRIRSNNELKKLIKGEYVIKYVKTQRIKLCEHLNRMKDIKLVKKITNWNPIGIRTKGRPNNRWRDEVMNALKKLKRRNQNQLVKDRKEWDDLVQKTKALEGL
jgi:hypothetical protein